MSELQPLTGGGGDPVRNERHADTGTGRDRNGAVRTDVDFGIDQIGRVVATARCHVTGQREVRQGREMNVVRPPDAALEHAAVPDRHAVARREVVHRERGAVAAEATRLDVDDPAGVERASGVGITGMAIGIGCEMPPVMSTRSGADAAAGAAVGVCAGASARMAKASMGRSIKFLTASAPE